MARTPAIETRHLKLIEEHAKTDWRASAWILERINPAKYARKAFMPEEQAREKDGVDELARKRTARRSRS